MSGVIIDALAGRLHGPQSIEVVAQLMAANGMKPGSVERGNVALTSLEELKSSGDLRTSVETTEVAVSGQWRRFEPWDREKHPPLVLCTEVAHHEGRPGFWGVVSSNTGNPKSIPGDMPVTEKRRTERIAPEDLATLLRGQLGEHIKDEGLDTAALTGWLGTAAESASKPMQRSELIDRYVFVKADGTVRKDSGQVLKELKKHGLQNAYPGKAGSYWFEDVRRIAGEEGLTMQLIRATVDDSGLLKAPWP